MNLKLLKQALLSLLLMLTVIPAQAEEDAKRRLWLSTGFLSWHYNKSADTRLRSENLGLGLQLDLDQEWRVLAGRFNNSNYAKSNYLGVAWLPFEAKVGNLSGELRYGLTLAAIDGYPQYRQGGWFVAPIPTLSYAAELWTLNFSFVPEIKNQVQGAFSVQFLLRLPVRF